MSDLDLSPEEFRAKYPYPGDDPVARLEHALAVYPAAPNERVVLECTRGAYGNGLHTELTFGDLRALAVMLRERT